jgi:predicted dehydrogenase
MEPVKALLLGAGGRGTFVYAQYAKIHPGELRIAAVAEPDELKRRRIQEEHKIPGSAAFAGWEEAFKALPPEIEAVIIATQDRMHTGPLLAAIERNLHILCEKPVAPTVEECRSIEQAAAGFNKVFMTGYVLKYTPFFSKIKELLDEGAIGKLIGIDHIENVGHVHMAHSFVRGNWRNLAESSPMILAKSCHDMDILAWLAGAQAESLASYGDLNYFMAENAPAGAPARCLEGCPQETACPYSAAKIYLGKSTDWPVNIISTDLSLQARTAAIRTGPYGRCVFHCDNDVVDHQTVAIRFANGVTANFTMTGFSMEIHRNITLFGTNGELRGDMEEARLTLKQFAAPGNHAPGAGKGSERTFRLDRLLGGHGGGDINLTADFVHMVRGEGRGQGRAVVRDAFESHYMAFAAETSRLNKGRQELMQDWRPSSL